MNCPNGCGKLTSATNSIVEFYDGEDEFEIGIYLEWCAECSYVHYLEAVN